MAFEEEITEAPPATDDDVPFGAPPIDDTIQASDLAGVGHVGDCIPRGTYHVRLNNFREVWFPRRDENRQDVTDATGATIMDPQFNVSWVIQEEPNIGSVILDSIEWVRKEDTEAARAGDPTARAIQRKRLVKANTILALAGKQVVGSMSFKEFLATNPQLKVVVIEKPKVTLVNGKWEETGELKNVITRYLSLYKPS